MKREYYVIRELPVTEEEGHKRAFELVKYNGSKQSSKAGNVYITQEGSFMSDDAGFKAHGNPEINRRIRIVRHHLESGEPKFACYWLNKGKVDSFKV